MKKILLVLSLATMLAGVSPAAHADLNDFLKSVNKQAVSDIKNFNDKLSRQFGIPVPDVEAILRSVPDPADAFMILQLGEMAHLAPAVVLQKYRRSKGKGWGNLAKELGIKPGSSEFHALKRGDLAFTGERKADAMERKGGGQGKGQSQEKSRGKGRQKD
jgi:hypothetical protein